MLKNPFQQPQPQPQPRRAPNAEPLRNQVFSTRLQPQDLFVQPPANNLPSKIVITEESSESDEAQKELEQQRIAQEIQLTKQQIDVNLARIKQLQGDVQDLRAQTEELAKQTALLRHDKHSVDLLRLERDYHEKYYLELLKESKSGNTQKLVLENKKLRILASKIVAERRSAGRK